MAAAKSSENAQDKLEASAQQAAEDAKQVSRDFVDYISEYAHENPGTACLWCLGIGFVLGWKLKPW